jgi:hypothetical protein
MPSSWKALPRAIGATAAAVALSACAPPAPESTVCKSLSFEIKKSEWTDVRRLMHDFSIESPGNPPFLDESHQDPVDSRYLRLQVKRAGVGVTIHVNGVIFRDGEKVTLRVVDANTSTRVTQCNAGYRADYDNIRAKLAARWPISESLEHVGPVR